VVVVATKRGHHHRNVADLEKKEEPPAPGDDASFSEKMAHRVATKEGRARYNQRQQTIEPVFGIIKEAIVFRRFSLRGQDKVALEWTLVCVAYNLRRLHRLMTIKTQNIHPAWAWWEKTALTHWRRRTKPEQICASLSFPCSATPRSDPQLQKDQKLAFFPLFPVRQAARKAGRP